MRLLTHNNDGTLVLTKKLGGKDEIPPYAILSHTWVEDEEVTYDDFKNKQEKKKKAGYFKIDFCAQQARSDGLKYFWVDTCCIDKTNNTELTQAINSMFKWYRDAATCYVYLSDVPSETSTSPETDFRNSRWFTRGWTLQELVAPRSVQFFDKHGELLGDKNSLLKDIVDVTGIPTKALQGAPLEEFSMDERKRWAKNRNTREEEDEVYSLLGLLDIYMPLIYGEGRQSAFRRLSRELKEVRYERGDELSNFKNLHWIVPHASTDLFTGRSGLIHRIRAAFRRNEADELMEQKRFVITGMGGQGKSEVCIKLANLMREEFWGVFWVDVSNESIAQSGFMAIAKRLGSRSETITDSIQLLANTKARWLLILDNADDPKFDYAAYFPSGNRGCVILTSRIHECQHHSTVGAEALEGLELGDSTRLLLRAAHIPEDSWSVQNEKAQEIVHLLGSHTLALVQAGAYIAQGYCRFEQYAQTFQKQRKQLLEHHPDQQQSRYKNVYATFEASIAGLRHNHNEESQDAIDLLAILSMLHASTLPLQVFEDAWTGAKYLVPYEPSPSNISPQKPKARRSRIPWRRTKQMEPPRQPIINEVELFGLEHTSRLPGFLHQQTAEWNSYRLKKATALLTSLSLTTRHRSDEHDEISMHPLVHVWASDRLSKEQQQQAWISTACILALSLNVSKMWIRRESQMLPHMQALVAPKPSMLMTYGPRAIMLPLLVRCGWIFGEVRDYIRLQKLLDCIYQEIGVSEWNLPYNSFSLWMLASRAALHLRHTRLAIFLLEHFTKLLDARMSPADPHRLRTRHDLSQAYNDAGQPEKAIPLLEELVKTFESLPPGTGYQDLKETTQYELTRAYNLTNQTDKAITLLEGMMQSQKPESGHEPRHNFLRTQHALAIAYTNKNRTADAVLLLENVVNTYKTLLSETHPDRLLAQQELGRVYGEDGQKEKCLEILQYVVRVREDTMQRTDLNLLGSQYTLANAYTILGRHQEALELRKYVVYMYEQLLEESHPDRLMAEYALGLNYVDVKEKEKALKVFRNVADVRRRTLESGHPLRLKVEQLLRRLEEDLQGG